MKDQSIDEWLGALGSRTPTPGGGAAAALAAATAASLISMVAEYTTGERWADRSKQMESLGERARKLGGEAVGLADEDAAAFAAVGDAYSMPKATESERVARDAAIQTALACAAQPPRRVGELAIELIGLAGPLIESGNPNVISDVAVAASLAGAALESAIVNVEVNGGALSDEHAKLELRRAVGSLQEGVAGASAVVARVRAGLWSR
ncbi:MAG TPA: cyclodeaminase/cyclohydrolase family protein [Solirubrobacterales bacterium]|nr:cyclodeaminase/cyclohydrolase family protein [Solirubrobacterales bacterium]